MEAFALASKESQPPSEKGAFLARAHLEPGLQVNEDIPSRRTIGNHPAHRGAEARGSEVEGDARTHDPMSFGHDFSGIPMHATRHAEPATGEDGYGVEHSAHDSVPTVHDFGSLRLLPTRSPMTGREPDVDVPVAGGPEEEIVDQPPGGGGTAGGSTGAPAPQSSDSCGQARSMDKLTSGAFLGGLTMDDYYPDLAGGGTYGHPGTGGTFDTGSRAGANVQLYAAVPSPCLPAQFKLEQTVTRTRFRFNGVAHADEGKTFDDLAKSKRDIANPPFRQSFLGGGTAPLGLIISMADPPSTGYNAKSNIEHDRDFTTTLVGPSGRQSVSWSLSTRISGGAVTSNVLS